MSVFRVEKNKNYTVMSNFHLKDKNLSLKTKGLLSIMLSLPEDWDYTEVGLTKITGEGRSAIRACLQQLEQFGYLERSQSRDEKGRLAKSLYIIYEVPRTEDHSPLFDFPTTDNPTSENQMTEKPTSENPSSENQTQLNTNKPITKELNTNPSINQSQETGKDGSMDIKTYHAYEALIKENTAFDLFASKRDQLDQALSDDQIDLDEYEQQSCELDPERAEKVIGYMLSILCSKSEADIVVNGDSIPREIVKSKLLKTDYLQLKSVVRELNTNPTIKNPKAYAISMLYNS